MDAVTSFKILGFSFATNTHVNIKSLNYSRPSSQLFRLKCKDFTLPSSSFTAVHSNSLRISYHRRNKPEHCCRVPTISCSLGDSYGLHEEKDETFSTDCQQEAVVDLKLPRRSLLITFTCDACGVRSQRLINRLAYEHGLVYVQCSGCSRYHKLVDNLGLVIEYNLQEENDLDANADQV